MKVFSLKSIAISKKTFWISFSVLLLTLTAVFGYFYWKKTSIVSMINDIPLVEYTKPPKYVHDIFGQEAMPFSFPLGVIASNGELFVSDSDLGVIQVFDYNGKYLRSFGNKGPKGKLTNPYGMASSNGVIYIADGGSGKILMYDRYGEYKGSIQPNEKDLMKSPAGIVVKDDKIYYTDLALRTVNVMDMEGNVLLVFGSRGSDLGQLDYPHSLVLDKENNIYVADSGNNRVQVFSEEGIFLKVLGGEKNEIGTPRGLAIDEKGNLYVVSGVENRVHVYGDNGEWVFAFNEVANKDSLSLPNGISIDNFGNIFISETGSDKVAVFSYNNISL